MKRIVLAMMFFMGLTSSIFAVNHNNFQKMMRICPQALPTSDPNFCASFKTSATCHCTASGLPAFLCQDMNVIYSRMIGIFGTVQRACEYQRDTAVQTCLDDWNCFRNGSVNSVGQLCSSNGSKCI